MKLVTENCPVIQMHGLFQDRAITIPNATNPKRQIRLLADTIKNSFSNCFPRFAAKLAGPFAGYSANTTTIWFKKLLPMLFALL